MARLNLNHSILNDKASRICKILGIVFYTLVAQKPQDPQKIESLFPLEYATVLQYIPVHQKPFYYLHIKHACLSQQT